MRSSIMTLRRRTTARDLSVAVCVVCVFVCLWCRRCVWGCRREVRCGGQGECVRVCAACVCEGACEPQAKCRVLSLNAADARQPPDRPTISAQLTHECIVVAPEYCLVQLPLLITQLNTHLVGWLGRWLVCWLVSWVVHKGSGDVSASICDSEAHAHNIQLTRHTTLQHRQRHTNYPPPRPPSHTTHHLLHLWWQLFEHILLQTTQHVGG